MGNTNRYCVIVNHVFLRFVSRRFHYLDYMASDNITIHECELERIWKEAIMAKSKYSPCISLEGLKKTTKTSTTIAGAPAEIRTELFSRSSIESYR
jgi:hypothetical protein